MAHQKSNLARKLVVQNELYELGIYVQDYGLYMSKQIGDILPLLKSLPRSSWLRNEAERISIAY
jgi:hypothetical protein